MKQAQRLFAFLVFSNIFIALCAVLMAWQTYRLLLPFPVHQGFLWFVFFATLCSYNFHWFLTTGSAIPSGRVLWTIKNRRFILLLFILGLAGSTVTCYIYFFDALSIQWMAIAVLMTFLYTAPKIPHPWFRALRKVALGKTIFLSFVWTYVTAILPVLLANAEWHKGTLLYVIARFFLIYAICILFDFRDREDDRIAGIKSFITYLEPRGIFILFGASIGVFGAMTFGLLFHQFTYAEVGILLLPGIIVSALYRIATKNFDDLLYYFVLDGLMALSALIMLITCI